MWWLLSCLEMLFCSWGGILCIKMRHFTLAVLCKMDNSYDFLEKKKKQVKNIVFCEIKSRNTNQIFHPKLCAYILCYILRICSIFPIHFNRFHIFKNHHHCVHKSRTTQILHNFFFKINKATSSLYTQAKT